MADIISGFHFGGGSTEISRQNFLFGSSELRISFGIYVSSVSNRRISYSPRGLFPFSQKRYIGKN